MMTDKRGNIWIGTTAGVSRFDPDYMLFENFPKESGNPKTFQGERVRSFLAELQCGELERKHVVRMVECQFIRQPDRRVER